MEDSGPQSGRAELAAVEQRVLDVVRQLAVEVGGARAQRAAAAGASLERDVGLGSLERVELQLRLESAFGRRLEDAVLRLDTPAALARALVEAGAQAPERPAPEAVAVPAAAPAPEGAATLQEALWRRAQSEPARPHVFLREEDGSEHTLSYGRLLAEASAVAAGLRERGVRRGETVALMLPTGLDFLRSFQGVLLAGGVPVPIYPPARLDRLQEYTLRQAAILADAGARILITIERALPVASLLRSRAPSLLHVTTAQALAEGAAGSAAPEGSAEDAALIQYTSGSTGQPKGVLLTHANLLANIKAIAAGLALRPTDVGVSWLPLYHDMGLIGSWLFCLYQGIPIDIQSPLAFLARPERWLWAIHRRRATLSAGPNFAYELCARKIPDAALEGLDLGSWRCALNGAEPVNPDTLERFAKRFARYGFAREALLPVYGLAESSVALCFPPAGRGPRVDTIARRPFESEDRAEPAPAGEPQPLRFVSVGAPLPGHEARVVDESGAELPERRVGRLVFRGPSATPGYFGKPEATRAITLAGGWLDSGDLAYRAADELYIAGRLKDLIIKAGRNLVPQEIEEAAEVEGVRKGCIAAFGVAQQAQGTESLVVVAETRVTDVAARERLVGAVTQAVAAALDLPPDVVVLAPPGAVPKTSSGKIRRGAARELYLRGQLGQAPRTSPGQWLRLGAALAGRRVAAAFRALGRALYAGYLALLLPGAALAAWGVLQAMRSRASVQRFQRACARALLRVAGCRLSATGLDRLGGGRGPFLLVCNHTSYVDVPALVALLPLDFVFLAKREAAGWPLVGSFLRKAGHLLVDRFDAQQSVADAAEVARAIEAGRSVLVFPEGTFASASGLRPFRLGAFKTAVDTGATVVPLALRGARRVLRDRSWLPRPGPIHLWVGDPIRPREESWRAVVELRDRAAEAIGAECGEPRLDLVFGGLPSPATPAEPGTQA